MCYRFLTSDEKQSILDKWDAEKDSAISRDEQGGRGFVDADIIPWCNKLNKIPGVCTVQSCAGHGSVQAGYVESPGRLWLYLDPEMSRVFDLNAFRLAKDSRIEEISRVYSSWGKEVTSILFAGNERDLLQESLNAILTFFKELEHEIASSR